MKKYQILFILFFLIPFDCFSNSNPILAEIEELAKATHSDAVLIYKNGEEVLNYSSEKYESPIETMSVTKSIVSLAIGLAIQHQLIESVDIPVSHYFKEWSSGEKRNVTLRHILNHTSGLMAEDTTENIYASSNFYEHALSSPLLHKPGIHFFYNNNAVNILPAIIEKASGMKIDVFLEKHLFDKLGIPKSEWRWSKDKSGNPHGMAGLQMKAKGLVKIGQLMVSNGIWENEIILDENWIQMSFAASQDFSINSGLLWWRGRDYQKDYVYYDDALLDKYTNAAIPKSYVHELEKIKNKKMLRANWYKKILELFGSKEEVNKFIFVAKDNDLPFGNVIPSPVRFYSAEGYLGQYLIIIPETKIVGVRLIHEKSAGEQTQFSNFGRKLAELK